MNIETVLLYEELKLIERSDADINNAWKGVHLLLFFMAFVFGSFCTFSFHMLMYLFDKKCVLYPKLLWLTSLPHDIIYEFIPVDKEIVKMLPVDFVSTQWMEKSVCYLPTYVPLMSGIFGIIWTTMFLVCYTSTGTLEGSRRSWRVLLPIFIFSVAMSGLCIYSSTITHQGLEELCVKLGEITGSATCTYTVNVATLAYERSIRGVYQAIKLTITSAWLHTSCWIISALLILVRVVLLVDFQLVRVKVELKGDLDKMLQQYEEQMRTVSPNVWPEEVKRSESLKSERTELTPEPETAVEPQRDEVVLDKTLDSDDVEYHYKNTQYSEGTFSTLGDEDISKSIGTDSEQEEPVHVVDIVSSRLQFIRNMLNELTHSITEEVQHQIELVTSGVDDRNFRIKGPLESFVQQESEEIARRRQAKADSEKKTYETDSSAVAGTQKFDTLPVVARNIQNIEDMPSTSKNQYESKLREKKSNLKSVGTQSDLNITEWKKIKPKATKVQILEPSDLESKSSQTHKKEKEE